MTLKFQVDSLEGIGEAQQSLYAKNDEDGKFYLQVEGAVSKKKLDEFRNNNITLRQEAEKYKDINLDKYNELLAAAVDADKKKMVPVSKIDEMVAEKTKTMQQEHAKTVQKLETEKGQLNSSLNTLLIDTDVRKNAVGDAYKVTDTAMDDVVMRAKTVFKVENGRAVPYDGNNNIIYGKDGTNPMSVNEWITGLHKTAPHLFDKSAGSGATGGAFGTGGKMDTSKMTSIQKIKAGLET